MAGTFITPADIVCLAEVLRSLPRVKRLLLTDCLFLNSIDVGILVEACPSLEYIVVHGTPLVSCEGYAAMETITNEQLAKMILFKSIDELQDPDWRVLVPDEARQSIVQQTHTEYYETYGNQPLVVHA
jgi:hypothetical protein